MRRTSIRQGVNGLLPLIRKLAPETIQTLAGGWTDPALRGKTIVLDGSYVVHRCVHAAYPLLSVPRHDRTGVGSQGTDVDAGDPSYAGWDKAHLWKYYKAIHRPLTQQPTAARLIAVFDGPVRHPLKASVHAQRAKVRHDAQRRLALEVPMGQVVDNQCNLESDQATIEEAKDRPLSSAGNLRSNVKQRMRAAAFRLQASYSSPDDYLGTEQQSRDATGSPLQALGMQTGSRSQRFEIYDRLCDLITRIRGSAAEREALRKWGLYWRHSFQLLSEQLEGPMDPGDDFFAKEHFQKWVFVPSQEILHHASVERSLQMDFAQAEVLLSKLYLQFAEMVEEDEPIRPLVKQTSCTEKEVIAVIELIESMLLEGILRNGGNASDASQSRALQRLTDIHLTSESITRHLRKALIVQPKHFSSMAEFYNILGVPMITTTPASTNGVLDHIEAEALAARLVQRKLAHAVLTTDTDVLLYDDVPMLTQRGDSVQMINGSDVRQALGFNSHGSWLDFAFLVGTDFTPLTLPDIGITRSYALIRKYGSIEASLEDDRVKRSIHKAATNIDLTDSEFLNRFLAQIAAARKAFSYSPEETEYRTELASLATYISLDAPMSKTSEEQLVQDYFGIPLSDLDQHS